MGITQSAGATRATIDKLVKETDVELLTWKKETEESKTTEIPTQVGLWVSVLINGNLHFNIVKYRNEYGKFIIFLFLHCFNISYGLLVN